MRSHFLHLAQHYVEACLAKNRNLMPVSLPSCIPDGDARSTRGPQSRSCISGERYPGAQEDPSHEVESESLAGEGTTAQPFQALCPCRGHGSCFGCAALSSNDP